METFPHRLTSALSRLSPDSQRRLTERFLLEIEWQELEEMAEPGLTDLRRKAQIEVALGKTCDIADLWADYEQHRVAQDSPELLRD